MVCTTWIAAAHLTIVIIQAGAKDHQDSEPEEKPAVKANKGGAGKKKAAGSTKGQVGVQKPSFKGVDLILNFQKDDMENQSVKTEEKPATTVTKGAAGKKKAAALNEQAIYVILV